jgi:hypothetical protein
MEKSPLSIWQAVNERLTMLINYKSKPVLMVPKLINLYLR